MKRALALALTVLVGSLIPGHAFATNNDQDGASPGCDANDNRFERRAPNERLYNEILQRYRCQRLSLLSPIVRITSPLADARLAPGQSRPGAGSTNGTNFIVTLELVERDRHRFSVNEATEAPPVLGIRDVNRLLAGKRNLNVPGLFFFIDADLINPDGRVLPAYQNLASAFNIAGSDDTPGKGVTTWLGWHVLESLRPEVEKVTLTVAAIDNDGRIGLDRITLDVDHSQTSGEFITPPPSSFHGVSAGSDDLGPEVSMIAPRVPTSIAIGPMDNSLTIINGALFFIQVSALDRRHAGIAASVNGLREGVPPNPSIPVGLIFDPTQIPKGGPNRNFPGLDVSFDVDLRQPNGNIVHAGVNLAPLFDIAGNEVDVSGAIRTTADWVVGGALMLPEGKHSVTITSKVTDNDGHAGSTKSIFSVSDVVSGQALTPAP